MKRYSRRLFLGALAGGLAVVAGGVLRRMEHDSSRAQFLLQLPPARTPGPPPVYDARSPNLRSGEVIELSPGELTISNSVDGLMRIILSDTTVRDEGWWVSSLPIELGDKVIARGGFVADGRFSARQIWVNFKNYIGPVLELLPDEADAVLRFRIQDRYDLTPWHEQHPEGHVVRIDGRTLVDGPLPEPRPAGPISLPGNLASDIQLRIEVGQKLQVLGREHRGALMAIRLML